MSKRNYSVQPTMFISPLRHATAPIVTPDKSLVEMFHKLLDTIENDNTALAIDYTVAQLMRVHVRPDGMFEPELLERGEL